VYEETLETLTGRPHDTSVQKATSDIENVGAVKRYAQDMIGEAGETQHSLHLLN